MKGSALWSASLCCFHGIRALRGCKVFKQWAFTGHTIEMGVGKSQQVGKAFQYEASTIFPHQCPDCRDAVCLWAVSHETVTGWRRGPGQVTPRDPRGAPGPGAPRQHGAAPPPAVGSVTAEISRGDALECMAASGLAVPRALPTWHGPARARLRKAPGAHSTSSQSAMCWSAM